MFLGQKRGALSLRGLLPGLLCAWAPLAAGVDGGGIEGGGEVAASYTLTQAFSDALARDPRIQAAEVHVAQVRERLAEVRSQRLPTLSLSGNAGYAHNRNQARVISIYEGESNRGRVRLSQNLYTFGRISARTRQAQAEIAEAEHAAAQTRQEALAEVAMSFADQLYRARILVGRRAYEASLVELEETARERLALGVMDQTLLFEVLRRLHRARAERLEAHSHYRVARARLARLTGADRNDLALVSLSALAMAAPASLQAALEQGERDSPALARARQRLEMAEGELAWRKAELWPLLSLQADASMGKVGDISTRDVSGLLNLEVPLYEGGLKRAQLRGARLAVETARRELMAERERLQIEARSNWSLLQGLEQASREFDAAIADIKQVVALTSDKLDAGRATFIQHIEARQSALDAEFELLNNRLRLEEVRIDLLRVLGALKP